MRGSKVQHRRPDLNGFLRRPNHMTGHHDHRITGHASLLRLEFPTRCQLLHVTRWTCARLNKAVKLHKMKGTRLEN